MTISRRSFLLGIPAVAVVPVAAMIAAPAEAAGFKLRGVIVTPSLLEEVQRIADASAARVAPAMGQPIAKVSPGEQVSFGPARRVDGIGGARLHGSYQLYQPPPAP